MMTRLSCEGVLALLTPPAYCHDMEDESPQWGPETKPRLGGLNWGRSPQNHCHDILERTVRG